MCRLRKNKKATLILILFCITLAGCLSLLTGCLFLGDKSFDYVNRRFHQDFSVIDAAVKNKRYDDAASLNWIKTADECDGYVDFYCGGSGMGPETNYSGFIFTQDDDPLAIWRKNDPVHFSLTASDFVETADGWEYRESDHDPTRDNVFIIRKLAPCYYYYHQHY